MKISKIQIFSEYFSTMSVRMPLYEDAIERRAKDTFTECFIHRACEQYSAALLKVYPPSVQADVHTYAALWRRY